MTITEQVKTRTPLVEATRELQGASSRFEVHPVIYTTESGLAVFSFETPERAMVGPFTDGPEFDMDAFVETLPDGFHYAVSEAENGPTMQASKAWKTDGGKHSVEYGTRWKGKYGTSDELALGDFKYQIWRSRGEFLVEETVDIAGRETPESAVLVISVSKEPGVPSGGIIVNFSGGEPTRVYLPKDREVRSLLIEGAKLPGGEYLHSHKDFGRAFEVATGRSVEAPVDYLKLVRTALAAAKDGSNVGVRDLF
ncbi:MAG: hypothetical protein V1820_04190 [archaeon]